jgi:hypothetical protein
VTGRKSSRINRTGVNVDRVNSLEDMKILEDRLNLLAHAIDQ